MAVRADGATIPFVRRSPKQGVFMWIKTKLGYANMELATELLQRYDSRPGEWKIYFGEIGAEIHQDDLEKALSFIEKNRL